MNNKKQFGVWMDNHHAVVVGAENVEGSQTAQLSILAHVKGEETGSNSNEKNANNHEKTLQAKFFKDISHHIVNATHVHITGTGHAQEQFIHFLAESPQFKNSVTEESTSNKMSDDKLMEFLAEKF